MYQIMTFEYYILVINIQILHTSSKEKTANTFFTFKPGKHFIAAQDNITIKKSCQAPV